MILFLYSIKNYKAQKLNSTNEIKLNAQFSEIIDLNNFYAINNLNQIYILNKKNLTINKTININIFLNKYVDKINFYYSYYFTFLLKISDSIITLFVSDNNNNIVIFQNYQISMSGIKWKFKKEENILKNTGINSIKMYNNNVLFLGNYNSYLINVKKLKEDIKEKIKKEKEKEEEKEKEKEEENQKENKNNEFAENQNKNCIII